MGSTNGCFEEREKICLDGEEVIWGSKPDTVFGSRSFHLRELILAREYEIWGLSYEIEYDATLFEPINYANKIRWRNHRIHNLFFDNELHDGSKTYLQIVQFNGTNGDARLFEFQNNPILSLIINEKDVPKTYPSEYTEIKICDVKVYYGDGSEKRLPAQNLRFRMPDSVVITSQKALIEHEFELYPNPAYDRVMIRWNESVSATASLIDMNGTILQKKKIESGLNQMSLPHNISPGFYMVKITTEMGSGSKKLFLYP